MHCLDNWILFLIIGMCTKVATKRKFRVFGGVISHGVCLYAGNVGRVLNIIISERLASCR